MYKIDVICINKRVYINTTQESDVRENMLIEQFPDRK